MADRADVRILPPIVLLFAFVLGLTVAQLWPIPFLPAAAAETVGIALIGFSGLVVVMAVLELKRAKTNFDVCKPTRTVVTTGVFSVTRNPVYLSMLLLCVGVAVWINSPWTLLIAILSAARFA